MNESHFDIFVRALTDGSLTRRTLARGLGGMALAAGLIQVDWDELEARKRRKRKKRNTPDRNRQGDAPPFVPPPLAFNRFGCVNVGQPCRGDSANCCSGICEGAAPAAGQPDASRCVAHDEGRCTPELDTCTVGDRVSCGADCACVRTTGQAGFCANDRGNPGGGIFCRDCARDTDCQTEFGEGVACVVLEGACGQACPETSGTACMPACP